MQQANFYYLPQCSYSEKSFPLTCEFPCSFLLLLMETCLFWVQMEVERNAIHKQAYCFNPIHYGKGLKTVDSVPFVLVVNFINGNSTTVPTSNG